MKKIIFLLIVLLPLMGWSQDGGSIQAYRVHEDQVKPSMATQYESLIKDLVANLKKHNITDVHWLTATTSDFRYMHVTKIDKMGDMDHSTFATLSEKMGKENLDMLFNEINKCYDRHGGYILYLDSDLSYMPDGMTQTPEGQPYRKFAYWQFSPADADKATVIAKEIKELFARKGAKQHYRIYRSGFGNMDTYFMVAIAAKDAVSFDQTDAETMQLLGEEGHELFKKALNIAIKYEEVSGYIRDDLSYMPK